MIFCADDFGQSPSINRAIVDLARKNKIQAVSVLVKSASKGDAELLNPYKDKIQIGLHLDLFANPKLDNAAEVERQIEMFKDLFQKFPDYIDGHMHCHIYPFWGKALIKALQKHSLPHHFYLRSVVLPPSLRGSCTNSKYLYLVWLNFWGRKFKRNLISAGLKSNKHCWGIYGGHAAINEVYKLALKNGSRDDIFFLHPDEMKSSGPHISDYDFALKPII